MANTNQIKPFGTGTGANVMDPVAWGSDTTRFVGFQAGLASSLKMNTALRQASFAAAMVAQFTADYGTSNVNDDGNVANFEAQFVAALNLAVTRVGIPEPALVHYGVDSGTANAMVITATPTITAYVAGLMIIVPTPAATNSGPTTANVASLGVRNIFRRDGATALKASDIVQGGLTVLYYDGSNFRLLVSAGMTPILNSATVFSSPGSFSYTVPQGVYFLDVEIVGGGSGGSSGDFNQGGGGGASGAYGQGVYAVTPGQVIPVVVGAGGAGGPSSTTYGSPGTASSFGSFITAPGGTIYTFAPWNIGAGQGAGDNPGSGGIFNIGSANGTDGSYSSWTGGLGGPTKFGSGGRAGIPNGGNGIAFGTGGGGAYAGLPNGTLATTTGGRGANGAVVIRYVR